MTLPTLYATNVQADTTMVTYCLFGITPPLLHLHTYFISRGHWFKAINLHTNATPHARGKNITWNTNTRNLQQQPSFELHAISALSDVLPFLLSFLAVSTVAIALERAQLTLKFW